jgi:hypothetical protein
MAEVWTLDGLSINDGTTFRIAGEVDLTPPRQRQEWIGTADSEWQALSRQPLHENREIVIPLEVVQQATKDLALDKVGQITDKLRLASRTQDGIALVWTPHGSTRQVTFDVLAGEISGFPLDVMFADFRMPRPTLRLVCKPYWRATEVTTTTASSSTPFVTMEVTGVPGDIPALGRLIVTDTATQNRRHVEWGLESQYYNAATSLLIDSDDMVVSGFSGAQTNTISGAYDPNASGNSSVFGTVSTSPTAMAGTGSLSHVGTFRVKARATFTATIPWEMRLAWQVADGPWSFNDWVPMAQDALWHEVDLGSISISPVLSGTQRWTGRVEVRTLSGSGTFAVDYLILVPAQEGYGKARAEFSATTGVSVGYDAFTSTTAFANLGGTTSDSAHTWTTSGAATDWVFTDIGPSAEATEILIRAASSTSPRYGVIGTTLSNTTIRARVFTAIWSPITSARLGLIARWTDASNYVRFNLKGTSGGTWDLEIVKVVAGVETVLASQGSVSWTNVIDLGYLEFTVYATGTAIGVWYTSGGAVKATLSAADSVLATGGTLDDGTVGIIDNGNGTDTFGRYIDDVSWFVPAPEPIALYSGRNMQFRHDDTIRQDSTGTYTGRPPSYRGSRFLVPVGTSRVLVKARRNDVETNTDPNVTDATQIQVAYTPRGLAVPRFG